jgi:hypothetical protein
MGEKIDADYAPYVILGAHIRDSRISTAPQMFCGAGRSFV